MKVKKVEDIEVTEEDIRDMAVLSFSFFYYYLFSEVLKRVEGRFLWGWHIKEWCDRWQGEERKSGILKTVTLASRDLSKSTSIKAYICWRLYRLDYIDKPRDEFLYLSYNETMAQTHLERLNIYIDTMKELGYIDFKRKKKGTFTKVNLITRMRKQFLVSPAGVFSFKRGSHPYVVIADDILKDPSNTLDLTQIEKITKLFLEEIDPMPMEAIHLVGTSQTRHDIFWKLQNDPEWDWNIYPILKDGKPIWEERYPMKVIEMMMGEEGTIKRQSFLKERMCVPVRETDSFINPMLLENCVDPELKERMTAPFPGARLIGGWDLGKRIHPSHISLFTIQQDGQIIQVQSKWFDRTNYWTQLRWIENFVRLWIESDGVVDSIYYDSTNGVLDIYEEKGDLPPYLVGVKLVGVDRVRIAELIAEAIENGYISFLKDNRQKSQILSVGKDLQAVETDEGHGDSFWSNGLGIKAMSEWGWLIEPQEKKEGGIDEYMEREEEENKKVWY